MITHKLFISVFSLFICFSSLAQTGAKSIPLIDKTKSYPEYKAKPDMDIKYVPLETSKDVLLGQDFRIYYLSDSLILGLNWNMGDVFFFNMEGKAISQFNQKDGLGYNRIGYAVYDNNAKEVYILDKVLRKIFVYTKDGTLKRSFKMPRNLTFVRIENFDNNLLLAFHEHAMGLIEPEQRNPYVFISKKDGSVVLQLNIHLDKANPRYLMSGNLCTTYGNTEEGNCKFGNEFYLSNKSMDTIYHLGRDQVLTPVFSQTPSVFSESHLISGIITSTDKFIVFHIYPFDLEKEKKRIETGNSMSGAYNSKYILFDKNTKQFYQLKNWNYPSDHLDAPANTCVRKLESYRLVEKYKLGLLIGELKEVASKLKVDDNPVVEITRFK